MNANERMQIRDALLDLLNSLGDTPDQVASSLIDGGFRGEPYACDACPVALYLANGLAEAGLHVHSVQVNAIEACVLHVGTDDDDEHIYVDVPQPVAWFIEQFDEGQHPNLIQQAVGAS